MGLSNSKAIGDDASKGGKPSIKQQSSRSNLGSCPSSFLSRRVTERAAIITDDLESLGTESSSSSPAPFCDRRYSPQTRRETRRREEWNDGDVDSSRSRSKSVPLKCPKPVRQSSNTSMRVSRSLEDEDLENLQLLYDLRTWNLYHRITEARKAKGVNNHGICHASSKHKEQDMYHHTLVYTDNTSFTEGHTWENSSHPFMLGELE